MNEKIEYGGSVVSKEVQKKSFLERCKSTLKKAFGVTLIAGIMTASPASAEFKGSIFDNPFRNEGIEVSGSLVIPDNGQNYNYKTDNSSMDYRKSEIQYSGKFAAKTNIGGTSDIYIAITGSQENTNSKDNYTYNAVNGSAFNIQNSKTKDDNEKNEMNVTLTFEGNSYFGWGGGVSYTQMNEYHRYNFNSHDYNRYIWLLSDGSYVTNLDETETTYQIQELDGAFTGWNAQLMFNISKSVGLNTFYKKVSGKITTTNSYQYILNGVGDRYDQSGQYIGRYSDTLISKRNTIEQRKLTISELTFKVPVILGNTSIVPTYTLTKKNWSANSNGTTQKDTVNEYGIMVRQAFRVGSKTIFVGGGYILTNYTSEFKDPSFTNKTTEKDGTGIITIGVKF